MLQQVHMDFPSLNYEVPQLEIINKYIFGSRLYGTDTITSDFDYVIVVSDSTIMTVLHYEGQTGTLIFTNSEPFYFTKKVFDLRHFTMLFENVEKRISYIIISEGHFLDMIQANIIWVLELLWTPQDNPYPVGLAHFKTHYDPAKLLACAKYEHYYAYNKAKSLFKRDPYLSRKNIFHSFRFLFYALQILNKGSIYNYSEANHYLDHSQTTFSFDKTAAKMLLSKFDGYVLNDSMVRILPRWLVDRYSYYDIRKYKDNDVVLQDIKAYYMGCEIVPDGEGITKRVLLKLSSHPFLEVVRLNDIDGFIVRFYPSIACSL